MARDIARTPAVLRDKILGSNENLRELAREEWREDVRQLRERNPAAGEDVDSVRGVDDAGAQGYEAG